MAKRKVRKYANEFKQSSAKLAVESEQPLSVISEELGVHQTTLHGWVKKYFPKSSVTSAKDKANDAMLHELTQLRKENLRLK